MFISVRLNICCIFRYSQQITFEVFFLLYIQIRKNYWRRKR